MQTWTTLERNELLILEYLKVMGLKLKITI